MSEALDAMKWLELGTRLAEAAVNVLSCEPVELGETLLRLEKALHRWNDQASKCRPVTVKEKRMRRCVEAVLRRDADQQCEELPASDQDALTLEE